MLLLLVPSLGPVGVLQCLCSGQFSLPALKSDDRGFAETACCAKHEKREETDFSVATAPVLVDDTEAPVPCDGRKNGGACWRVVSFDAIAVDSFQVPAAPLTGTVTLFVATSCFDEVRPPDITYPLPPAAAARPPGTALPVLYSTLLI